MFDVWYSSRTEPPIISHLEYAHHGYSRRGNFCGSVFLSVLLLNDISHSKRKVLQQVSEEVNRKCPDRNMTIQLSTLTLITCVRRRTLQVAAVKVEVATVLFNKPQVLLHHHTHIYTELLHCCFIFLLLCLIGVSTCHDTHS